MIQITHIRVNGGEWQDYDKQVQDMKSVAILRTLSKIHHQTEKVNFKIKKI